MKPALPILQRIIERAHAGTDFAAWLRICNAVAEVVGGAVVRVAKTVRMNDNRSTNVPQWWVTNPDDVTHWLPINIEAEAEDENDVRALFAGNGRTKPMTFAHRCLSPVFGNLILEEREVTPEVK